jgi:hypothetical protein
MRRVDEGADEIAVLLSRIEAQDDPRESFALLREQMAKYQEAGDAVPEELMLVQKAIETDLIAASRGE